MPRAGQTYNVQTGRYDYRELYRELGERAMTDDNRMVSRAFHASKYREALEYKARVHGIMKRFVHPTMGVMYEVRLVPELREVILIGGADSEHNRHSEQTD